MPKLKAHATTTAQSLGALLKSARDISPLLGRPIPRGVKISH
jgi:hypothetical protein